MDTFTRKAKCGVTETVVKKNALVFILNLFRGKLLNVLVESVM